MVLCPDVFEAKGAAFAAIEKVCDDAMLRARQSYHEDSEEDEDQDANDGDPISWAEQDYGLCYCT